MPTGLERSLAAGPLALISPFGPTATGLVADVAEPPARDRLDIYLEQVPQESQPPLRRPTPVTTPFISPSGVSEARLCIMHTAGAFGDYKSSRRCVLVFSNSLLLSRNIKVARHRVTLPLLPFCALRGLASSFTRYGAHEVGKDHEAELQETRDDNCTNSSASRNPVRYANFYIPHYIQPTHRGLPIHPCKTV
jgi:hypothetical protein